jgi:putative flippase GtrA
MTKLINKKLTNKIFSIEIVRFLFVGGFAASVNFFSRMFFRIFSSYQISVFLGYLFGTVISFIFNKTYTFKAYGENSLIQFGKFILITPTTILLGSIVASYSVKVLSNIPTLDASLSLFESLGHLMAIIVTTIYNYLMIKYFCFRKISKKKL